jgi:hypothetical protein
MADKAWCLDKDQPVTQIIEIEKLYIKSLSDIHADADWSTSQNSFGPNFEDSKPSDEDFLDSDFYKKFITNQLVILQLTSMNSGANGEKLQQDLKMLLAPPQAKPLLNHLSNILSKSLKIYVQPSPSKLEKNPPSF